MKKVDFNKLQAGDLVEVPRTQFAPMRSGWNGWLFSEAVVIRKGVGRKSKRNTEVSELQNSNGKPQIIIQQERKITCGMQIKWVLIYRLYRTPITVLQSRIIPCWIT